MRSDISVRSPHLVVDVSPLWETQYTGISNVVSELAQRFLDNSGPRYQTSFSVFHKVVPESLVAEALREKSGAIIRQFFESQRPEGNNIFRKRIPGAAAALYLHTKPPVRTFDFESQLYYDFSFLSVPECHTPDTVGFHTNGLREQVDSTDRFFTISESTAADLSFYFGVEPEKIDVAHLGAHFNHCASTRAKNLLADSMVEPYFLCLGTIEPRKNIRLILAWIKNNDDILSSYRFVFVGREGWGPSFSELVAEYELNHHVLSGRILHLGYVSENQKTLLLCGAKGLLFPSLFEGFGLPVLEAMALGIPVASSCSTSLPEVLGNDGIYFDPYSLESFSAAMSTLILESLTGSWRRRSDSLRRRADTFSYDRCFEVIRSSLDKHFFAAENTVASTTLRSSEPKAKERR